KPRLPEGRRRAILRGSPSTRPAPQSPPARAIRSPSAAAPIACPCSFPLFRSLQAIQQRLKVRPVKRVGFVAKGAVRFGAAFLLQDGGQLVGSERHQRPLHPFPRAAAPEYGGRRRL